MKDERRDFDSDAQHWDENPERVRLADSIADAILEEIEFTNDVDVLDFGCGTGLVTLRLQPYARSITGLDSSPGMLDMLNRKIKKLGLTNVTTKLIKTETDELIEGRYNLIVSSMTFHHISNIKSVLDQLSRVALPSAYLCVADLDSEGGLFHGDNTGVSHYGFNREALSRMFIEAGFEKVRHRTAATVTKPIGDDKIAEFSVFLIIGRKNEK